MKLRTAGFIILCMSALGFALRRSFTPAPAATIDTRIDVALARAGRALLKMQSVDGAFRSATYGALKDDLTLTPHVLYTLERLPEGAEIRAARARATAHLLASLTEDRRLAYPVYTLATAISCLAYEHADSGRIAGLVRRLCAYQFEARGGWAAEDLCYGGWGYNSLPLSKAEAEDPARAGPGVDANLSATAYALRALRDAAVAGDDPVMRQALGFVRRCQNYALGETLNDGGFFFSPVEIARNKAAEWGKDGSGRMRYRSYGSMTADGVRAMAYAGVRDAGADAGAAWLRERFATDVQPGAFPKDRELFRFGMYYYYLAAAAQAGNERADCVPPGGARAMAEALLRRQQEDGTWRNSFTDSREDDPLVATMHGALALALCRGQVGGLYLPQTP